jgi:hypothetical protein
VYVAQNGRIFDKKNPSIVTRILDFGDCPPHSVGHSTVHDITTYPHYYYPLYFPHFHTTVYASASTFCSWSQHSVVIHCIRYLRCVPPDLHVAVVFDGVSLFIAVDGLQQTFSLSHFEFEIYTLQCLSSLCRRSCSFITYCCILGSVNTT